MFDKDGGGDEMIRSWRKQITYISSKQLDNDLQYLRSIQNETVRCDSGLKNKREVFIKRMLRVQQ